MSKGVLLVLSGPSGAGKGTVALSYARRFKETHLSLSATTRAPREGEREGEHYKYVSRDKFMDMIKNNEMIEYAEYVGNYYGTPAKPVDDMLNSGKNVLLEIDIQGGLQVREKRPDAVLVFLVPPSIAELEKRLRGRGTESDDVIEERLRRALEEYEKAAASYEYVIINNTVESAVKKLEAIFVAERCKRDKENILG